MKSWAPLVLLATLLAGCSDPEPTKKPTETEPTTASPTVPALNGTFAPESLIDFQCRWATGPTWKASGVVKNVTTKTASYQLTVYVGAVGSSGNGVTKRFDNVKDGGSVTFTLEEIPGHKDDTDCHAQLVRLKTP